MMGSEKRYVEIDFLMGLGVRVLLVGLSLSEGPPLSFTPTRTLLGVGGTYL
jgi:hypothetical protein